MKATGIVRRIDDLGRVVIPKEIRRTLRIREGDPLEIFTSNDGEVIFKKVFPPSASSPPLPDSMPKFYTRPAPARSSSATATMWSPPPASPKRSCWSGASPRRWRS